MSAPVTTPRITVVTPTLNQAPFIEQTIVSVLEQGYANLEYLVIDGGSTDGTVDVIRRHSRHLAAWVSERDRGQSHAINKGLARATGDVVAYLNGDDFYLPGALQAVAEAFTARPEVDLIHGRCRYVDEGGATVGSHLGRIDRLDDILDLWEVWWSRRQFVQPEVFWRRRLASRIGEFREDLNFVMDYEYWVRALASGARVHRLDGEVAAFRRTPQQKSSQSDRVARELLAVVEPWLWRPSTPIGRRRRLQLQARWLYSAQFLEQVRRAEHGGQSRARRWRELLGFVTKHPKVMLAPEFSSRLLQVTYGRLRSLRGAADD